MNDMINQGAGLPMREEKFRFCNRTGATLKKGQFAMLDQLRTQAETTGYGHPAGEGATVRENLTPVTQAGYDFGYPIVCAAEDIADNAWGLCYTQAPDIVAAILDDDVSTTDIDKGDPVSILVSESAVAGQAFVSGTAQRIIGYAHEDAAASTDSSATQIDASSHLRHIAFFGGAYGAGFSDT